jgi:hypothetical protein
MSSSDNDFIFEAYTKKQIPLEESISLLLKNDLILANHIYNEWSMSDWHSGVKKVANKSSDVGGFLMDKAKKYIVNPVLDSLERTKIWYELSRVKTKEELAKVSDYEDREQLENDFFGTYDTDMGTGPTLDDLQIGPDGAYFDGFDDYGQRIPSPKWTSTNTNEVDDDEFELGGSE